MKTPGESNKQAAKQPDGELVPQPHGGAIYANGNPNFAAIRQPGPGRPASKIRKKLRGSFASRIKTLEQIADSQQETTGDRLKAIDLMGKYGLGTTKELTVDTVRERLQQTIDTIRQVLPPDEAKRLLDALEPIWA